MDAASYQKKIITRLNNMGLEFFIRAHHSELLYSAVADDAKWTEIEINNRREQVTSIFYNPTKDGNNYRLIITRSLEITRKNKNKYTGDYMSYRAIITNNMEMTPQQVVHFYNQRGAIERNFDALLNDFNWRRVPFSFLNQNVVFMLIGAISKILYRHIILTFSKKVNFVKQNYRLKKFITRFIILTAEWNQIGDSLLLDIYTDKDYQV